MVLNKQSEQPNDKLSLFMVFKSNSKLDNITYTFTFYSGSTNQFLT